MTSTSTIRVPEEFQLEPSLVQLARRITKVHSTANIWTYKTSVWLMEDLAFKKPKLQATDYSRRSYIKEMCVAEDLKSNGINSVPIHGLDFGETADDSPIIVTTRLAHASGIYYDGRAEELSEEYERQMAKARGARYGPRDTAKDHNCGVGYDGRLYFFDFERWHVPGHIRDRINSLCK